MSHSPGPWRRVEGNQGMVVDAEGRIVVEWTVGGPLATGKDNATLISLAPTMLELLRAITFGPSREGIMKECQALLTRIDGKP